MAPTTRAAQKQSAADAKQSAGTPAKASPAKKTRPAGGSQARRAKRNAKKAAVSKTAAAASGGGSNSPAVRHTAQNPPPSWTPVPLDPPCENCLRGVISGKRTEVRCESVYGVSNRCRSCFDTGHACDPCRAALAPLAKRYVVALAHVEANIPFEDEMDSDFEFTEEDEREIKFEKRLKPCIRMMLDLLDEDEDVNTYFPPSAYVTAAQGAAAGGSSAGGDGLGAVVSQMITQQVQQALQGNPQP